MFAKIESFIRRARRRFSRSEWAIRHLGLTPSHGTSEKPGLLLIQVDGLARSQLEKALDQGRMPFLRHLIRRNGYELHTFYPGLPSTTPAVQAELFYGARSTVPAFCFLDRRQQSLSIMFTPACAKEREAACAAKATGLLEGGSSWSNIYTGGAGQAESHFCIATNGLGDMWRTGKIRNIFVFSLLQLPALLRILALLAVEFGAAWRAALRGIRHGRRPGLEFSMILSRVFIATGLRELLPSSIVSVIVTPPTPGSTSRSTSLAIPPGPPRPSRSRRSSIARRIRGASGDARTSQVATPSATPAISTG